VLECCSGSAQGGTQGQQRPCGQPAAGAPLSCLRQVIDVEWDASLGSNTLDMRLVEHFVDEFAAKYPDLSDIRRVQPPPAPCLLRPPCGLSILCGHACSCL
jgi:hypothetical protein